MVQRCDFLLWTNDMVIKHRPVSSFTTWWNLSRNNTIFSYHDIHVHICQVALDISGSPVSHDIMTYMCIPVKLPWIFPGAPFLMISWHTCAYLSSCPGYFREPRFSWYHDIHVHTCQVALDISGSPVDFQRAPWNIQGNLGMHASMDSCEKDVTPLLTLPEISRVTWQVCMHRWVSARKT